MKKTIHVIDYGVGNLFSVKRALRHCTAEVVFVSTPAEIAEAPNLVLPGVGAFGNGMEELRKRQLVEPIREFARSGRPFLGICLGMQLMMDGSDEFGLHEGLGLIRGNVQKIPDKTNSGEQVKIPHIGWNALLKPKKETVSWEKTILEHVAEGEYAYFVHSYVAHPENSDHILATASYGGYPITAVIASGSLSGCQFHPELSGPTGLKILKEFINTTNL